MIEKGERIDNNVSVIYFFLFVFFFVAFFLLLQGINYTSTAEDFE